MRIRNNWLIHSLLGAILDRLIYSKSGFPIQCMHHVPGAQVIDNPCGKENLLEALIFDVLERERLPLSCRCMIVGILSTLDNNYVSLVEKKEKKDSPIDQRKFPMIVPIALPKETIII